MKELSPVILLHFQLQYSLYNMIYIYKYIEYVRLLLRYTN